MAIETGIEPGSVSAYMVEWNLYEQFCRRKALQKIPGKDEPFDVKVMAKYLRWRANRNKAQSLAGIKSKLKHVGLCYDFLLSTAKNDGPGSKLRLQLAKITKSVANRKKKAMAVAGKTVRVHRALALGKIPVGMLFSAYGAATERGFRRADKAIRHWLCVSVSMHTGCMRNRLMQELWNKGSARWSQIEESYRIAGDWRKMKHGGPFSIKFPAKPQLEPMVYPAFNAQGKKIGSFTAADVLRWQIDIEGSNKCKHIWAPTGAKRPTRSSLQAFIRKSFQQLLMTDDKELKALVQSMTPHSFRAGMAGDLDRAGYPLTVNMKIGRWESERAAKLYIRDGLTQRIQQIRFRRIKAKTKKPKRKRAKVCKVTSSSEGYDASRRTSSSSERKFPPTNPGTPPHSP